MTHRLLLVLSLGVTASGPAQAYQTHRLHPAPDRASGFVALHSATPVGWLGLGAGVVGGYAADPLVLDDAALRAAPYEANGRVVTDQTALHLLATVGLRGDLDVGLDLPVLADQRGAGLAGLDEPRPLSVGPGLDDLRIVPRWQAVDLRFGEGLGLAAAAIVDAGLPTGEPADLSGGVWRVAPLLAIEGFLPAGVRAAVNAGWVWQEQEQVVGHVVEDHVSLGLGLDLPLAEAVRLLLEVQSEVATEARAALCLGWGRWRLELGGGAGLPDDVDAPDWRVLAGLSLDLHGERTEPIVLASGPEPPAEPPLTWPPARPRPRSWQDRAPAPAPAPPPRPAIDTSTPGGPRQHAIDVIVHFDRGGVFVPRHERPALDRLAGTLLATPATGHVWLQGHADGEGDSYFNLALSKRRAEVVRAYLVERGVPASRLTAVGLGQSRPLDHNDNPEGRHANRRVEFRVAPLDRPPPLPIVELPAGPALAAPGPPTAAGESLPGVSRRANQPIDLVVHFGEQSAEVPPEALAALRQLARRLNSTPAIRRVLVEGHSAPLGDQPLEVTLARHRAHRVLALLVELGVDPSRLATAARGAGEPVATGTTILDRHDNRRVEFRIDATKRSTP